LPGLFCGDACSINDRANGTLGYDSHGRRLVLEALQVVQLPTGRPNGVDRTSEVLTPISVPPRQCLSSRSSGSVGGTRVKLRAIAGDGRADRAWPNALTTACVRAHHPTGSSIRTVQADSLNVPTLLPGIAARGNR
jgi:hypothetical protein